ncbi:11363_t:CDS:2, partial [Funneliformis caledonium]
EYVYCSPSRWIEAKKHQLRRRLDKAVYGSNPDFSGRFLIELLNIGVFWGGLLLMSLGFSGFEFLRRHGSKPKIIDGNTIHQEC